MSTPPPSAHGPYAPNHLVDASRKALNWAIASALIGPILMALWFFLFGGLALLGGLSGM